MLPGALNTAADHLTVGTVDTMDSKASCQLEKGLAWQHRGARHIAAQIEPCSTL
jgi:hypothetical protein